MNLNSKMSADQSLVMPNQRDFQSLSQQIQNQLPPIVENNNAHEDEFDADDLDIEEPVDTIDFK